MTEEKRHKFLIECETLEKLRERFEKAAELVKAAAGNAPIILKHHGDCDGYMGAIPIEIAIDSIMKKSRESWRMFKRAPSRTPYYDYIDVLKDLTNQYREIAAGRSPLLIIVDSGSSEQDILALKKAKQFGLSVIVIDHHEPFRENGELAIKKIVDVFINPHEFGGDSSLTAGMLGVEFARFVNDKIEDMEHMAAVSGISDKSSGKIFEDYMALAKKKGYDPELLQDIAKCVDFDAYFLGFMESNLVEDLLLCPIGQQKLKTALMIPEIKEREKKAVKCINRYARTEKIKDFSLVMFSVNELIDYGSYPPQGKSAGLFFDSIKQDKVIVAGIGRGSITIRTNLPDFDFNRMIGEMKERFSYAQVEGGGHKSAGTVHFVEAAQDEIIGFMKEYLGR